MSSRLEQPPDLSTTAASAGKNWEWAPVHWTNDDHAPGASKSKIAARPFLDSHSGAPVPQGTSWLAEPDFLGKGFIAPADAISEASSVTSKLLDPSSLQGPNAPLKRWFAWALEQHQEATQRHIEQQHKELKTHLDEVIATVQDRGRRKPHNTTGAAAPADSTAPGTMGEPLKPPLKEKPKPPKKLPPATVGMDKPKLELERFVSSDAGDENDDDDEILKTAFSATRIRESVQYAKELSMPLEKAWAKEIIRRLNSVAILVVCLNSLFIYFQLDQQGIQVAVKLGLKGDVGAWGALDTPFLVADHLFNAFFVFELCIKCYILRWQFVSDAMSIFDSVVVVVNCVNLLFLDGSSNAALARLARIFKVMRVVRVSRVARASHELRVLLSTLFLSMRALVWSAVLLALIILIAGLAMAQFVGMFLLEECDSATELCVWAYTHYGGASRASWTMFQVTLSGGWPQWATNLVEDVNAMYVFFWIIYIVVVWFAVIRILTALFLKQTMEVASADQEMMINEKMRMKSKFAEKLRNFFILTDRDGSGFISCDEFMTALEDPKAKAWLNTLEIETHEVEALFHMLDDGDGEISFEEFLGGAVRLKGTARSIDQVTMIHNQNKMLARMEQLRDGMERTQQH